MEFFKKYLSRKLLTTVLFGVAVPVLFKAIGISETVTLASLTMGSLYLGANALVKTKTGSE